MWSSSRLHNPTSESMPQQAWSALRELIRSVVKHEIDKSLDRGAKKQNKDLEEHTQLLDEVMERLARSKDKEVTAYRKAYLVKKRQHDSASECRRKEKHEISSTQSVNGPIPSELPTKRDCPR